MPSSVYKAEKSSSGVYEGMEWSISYFVARIIIGSISILIHSKFIQCILDVRYTTLVAKIQQWTKQAKISAYMEIILSKWFKYRLNC